MIGDEGRVEETMSRTGVWIRVFGMELDERLRVREFRDERADALR